MRFRALLLIIVLILVGCRQTSEPNAENVSIDVAVNPETPVQGDATLLITVTDDNGTPINDASVTVRGDMTHAGMVPVIPEPVSDATDGVYEVPFEFTMAGDWIITVDVTLANGEIASTTYEIDGVSGDDMSDMDMNDEDMSDMDMSSAISGAYMSITNNSETDVTLVAVSADAVGMSEIHETLVDDNDMASMQEVEGGLTIAAGDTVDLMPGGLHLMLMQLESDLIEGETISLTLEFDDGTNLTVDAPIVSIAPETSETVEVGDISVTAYWVRPTAIEAMSDMDMEATEEAE